MKKIYKLEDLDCANCAAKMENAINAIDGVQSATVSFMMQRLTIEADDANFDDAVCRSCVHVARIPCLFRHIQERPAVLRR